MEDIPKVRFKGFTDAWERRKLGDMGSLKNGMNFSKDAMDKGYPFVNLQNIFGKNIIDVNKLGKAEASIQQLKEYSLEKGDVLFVRSSVKLEGVGEAALVPKTLENTTYSGFVIRFRDEVGLNDNFKRFVFSIKSVRDQIMAQATNSANKNVSQAILGNLTIAVPGFEEQEIIGDYFSHLDHFIILHQHKCDETKRLKKYMLQKMFPKNGKKIPDIRFAGFTGDWEQRKLNEIAEKVTEKNKNNIYHEPLTNSAEMGIISQKDYFDREIVNKENLEGYYVVKNDDFVYNPRVSVTASVGPINRNKLGRNGIMSPLYTVFRTHAIDVLYLEYYFKTTKWHRFMKLNGDSGARFDRFTIATSKFMEMPIPYPDLEEQIKIGQYFANLDHLITLHQRKCDELKEIKKFMLQNMFPQKG